MKKNKISIAVIAGTILVVCVLLYFFAGKDSMWNTSDRLKMVSGLKASFNDSDGSVKLTWKAMKGAEGYRLYRSPLSKSDFTLLGTVNTNDFIDKNANTEDLYQYIVQAYTGALYGPYTGIMAGKRVNMPASPTAKIATDGTHLSWNPIEGVEGYKIYRSANYSSGYKGVEVDCKTTSFIDKTAKNKAYCYKVIGFKKVNGVSIYTALSAAGYDSGFLKEKGPGLAAPKNVTAARADKGVQISWQAVEGADSYKVYRSEQPGKDYKSIINSSKKLSFIDTKSEAGKTYYYKVAAFKKYGTEYYYGPLNSNPATVK